jgi:hypothetical protein
VSWISILLLEFPVKIENATGNVTGNDQGTDQGTDQGRASLFGGLVQANPDTPMKVTIFADG